MRIKQSLLFASITVLTMISYSASASLPMTVKPVDSAMAKEEVASSAVKEALAEYKSLSRKDRNNRLKEVKSMLKEYKAEKKAGGDADTNTILLCIVAILLPPLAVYLYEKEINTKFWISLLLTLLFWLPGVIYALLVILAGA